MGMRVQRETKPSARMARQEDEARDRREVKSGGEMRPGREVNLARDRREVKSHRGRRKVKPRQEGGRWWWVCLKKRSGAFLSELETQINFFF
jgi:hypothetical protein